MIIQSIDGIKFRLKENHDFSWLSKYGNVFTVFDEHDSGNISFGVDKGGIKKFIKYAGAKTIQFNGAPEDAINRLMNGATVYKDLRHPYLVNFIDSFQVNDGYAMIFDWFNGECLHSHWLFTPEEKYTHPQSPNYKFERLSIPKRLEAFKKILEFHVYVEVNDYVGIDFYDGSILYNFKTDDMKICDIDFYSKRPYVNDMGEMWGSKRFKSPEESKLGAVIDEKTNVYNMGAIAFSIFGGTLDRSKEKWTAGDGYYNIALKAVSESRNDRYPSVSEFYNEWMGMRENL